jgi:hypothetical protein
MTIDGPLRTLSLLEELRAATSTAWSSTSSDLYHRVDALLRELADPRLHDIPMRLPFRVELWDRPQQHIRWVIAASSSIAVARAAFEAAVKAHPHENLTLRNGALVIREHAPQPDV